MTAIRPLPFPDVGRPLLDEHGTAHARAAEVLSPMPALLRETAVDWLRDRATSSLAGIRPAWFGGTTPPLFPAPRGYLDRAQRDRLSGTRAGLAHVEARLQGHGRGRPLVSAETPFVLNALTEGRRGPDRSSTPGLIRSTDTRWHVRDHPYDHPPAGDCPALLDVTLEALEADDELHPVVAGAWLAFSLLSIHPFTEGNGRTGRLLHLLVSAPATSGPDLGIAEQWVFHRHHWQRALEEGNRVAPGFDAERLDATPFTEATLQWSTEAARLLQARLSALSRAWRELAGLDDPHRAAVLAASLHRFVTPDDLAGSVGDYPARLDVLQRLVSVGALVRVVAPPSRRVPGAPPRPHFAVAPTTLERLGRAVAASG